MNKERNISFANTAELIEFVKCIPDKNYSKTYDRPSFCKYTFDETVDAIQNGWREGVRDLLDINEQIDSKLDEIMSAWGIRYDVSGEYIDMGRYVIGEPECCGSVVRDVQLKPVVNIFVANDGNHLINQQAFEKRGAVILSLVDQLRKDHIVKVFPYCSAADIYLRGITEYYNSIVMFGVDTVNEYSKEVLAAYVAHPGLLRRICFGIEEVLFDKKDLRHCLYGSTLRFNPQKDPNEKYIEFGPIERNNYYEDITETVAFIANELNRLRGKENTVEYV